MLKNTPGTDSFAKEDSLKSFSDNIFIFAVFLISLLTAISFYQFKHLTKTHNWVTHTYEVILSASNSINLYKQLESKQREYIFFNDIDSLQVFNLYSTKLNSSLNQLTQLTADNPNQAKRVHNFLQLVKQRIVLFIKAIDLKKAGQYTANTKQQLFSQGKALTDEIDNTSQEIIDKEKQLLQERNDQLLSDITIVTYMTTSGQILSIFFLLIAFFASHKQFRQRLVTESNSKLLSIQLQSIIEGANDMIVAIDDHYQYLVFNDAYRDEFKKLFGKDIHVGQSLKDLLPDQPEVKNKLLQNWEKSLAGDKTIKTIQFPVNGVDNTYELTPSLIHSEDGKTLGALHIIRNITERIKEQSMLKHSYEELNAATKDLKVKNDKITLLLEMSDILLVTDSMDELSAIVPNYCNKILGFSSGNFYIMHPSKDILDLSAQWGSPEIKTEVFTHNQCWALRLGRAHHSVLNSDNILCGHVHAVPNQDLGYICVSLRAQNEVFGVLYLEYDVSAKKSLSATERLLVNAFAEVMALALANVRLRDNLRYQSIRDPLTNLHNRRYLEEFLSKQLFLARRENTPITVLMLDLDHFKRINDVHGHDAGDIALKEFSRLLLQFVRRSDLATRFGGEEFVVVLYDADKSGGFERANKIREAVSHLNIKYGNQDIHLTVSIGMSSYPKNAREGKELIELADKALYAAKNSGRNQVIHYDDTLEKIEL